MADNIGLAGTGSSESVAPVFVLDDVVLAHAGPPRVQFLCDALSALREAYRERGSDLLVLRGDPAEEIPALASDLHAERREAALATFEAARGE